MANSLERKIVKFVTDDFGLPANTALNLGVDVTEREAGNVDRAVKILKKNTNLTDYAHLRVTPDAGDPKTPILNFGDYIVQSGMENKDFSVGKDEQERIIKRFAESGGKPFDMAVKVNKNSGIQVPTISDADLGSTLGRKVVENDTMIVPDPAFAWLNRPSSNPASAAVRNTLGALVGEGPVRRATESFQDWAGNKTAINWLGSGVRRAAPVGAGVTAAKAKTELKRESEAERAKRDEISAARNVVTQSEVDALTKVLSGKDTNDSRFFPNSGKMKDVPNSIQNEVWEDVRKGLDESGRTTSVYKVPADKVMEKFVAAYDFKGQANRWKRSTGRTESGKVVYEDIPKSDKWSDSAEPRIISPSYVMDPSDKKYGILGKPDEKGVSKRYVGAILDLGTAHVKKASEASKKANEANKEKDQESSDLSKPKTFKELFEQAKKDPVNSSTRYKWVFFEVGGDKSGVDAIYTDKDGNIATPEFK
jgi:hypothetical protein